MAILFSVNYIFSEDMPDFLSKYLGGESTSGDWAASLHIYVGLSFIVIAVIRLSIRTSHYTAEIAKPDGHLLIKLAYYIHNGLYVLMFLVPIAGMSALYAKVELFGDMHIFLVNFFLAIIVLHITAVLYHQFILKDNLFSRMIMFKQKNKQSMEHEE
jgi:cytochrome b561